jgi:hypothetical protein
MRMHPLLSASPLIRAVHFLYYKILRVLELEPSSEQTVIRAFLLVRFLGS